MHLVDLLLHSSRQCYGARGRKDSAEFARAAIVWKVRDEGVPDATRCEGGRVRHADTVQSCKECLVDVAVTNGSKRNRRACAKGLIEGERRGGEIESAGGDVALPAPRVAGRGAITVTELNIIR